MQFLQSVRSWIKDCLNQGYCDNDMNDIQWYVTKRVRPKDVQYQKSVAWVSEKKFLQLAEYILVFIFLQMSL